MRNFSFLFFFLIAQCVFCQEENTSTLIFNDSTTVKGYGEIRRNKIFFSLSEKDKKSEWSYDVVKGIIFSGYGYSEKYEYILPEKYTEPLLVEVIEEGRINLYRKNVLDININSINLGGGNFSSQLHNDAMNNANTSYDVSSTFFVIRASEKNAVNISSGFKTKAARYFSDCEIILKKLKNRTFSSDNIPQIITYYNNYCDGQED